MNMIKVLLASTCLVLLAAHAQAGGLDDFKAANAAVEQGQSEVAIRLFTEALSSGDLSPTDQLTAHWLRGREYTARSLIADAFQKQESARALRDSAISDFTAALALKPNDDRVCVARAEARHMNGDYDAAVADFDAAIKIKSSPVTLVQRAASLRAKGDYDRAIDDYSAAIAASSNANDDSASEIHNERGFAQFLAGRFDSAATDFERALALGTTAHTGDVLWLPYQAAWLHIARARAGQNDDEELARSAAKIDLKQWPGTLIAYFMGQITLDQVASTSTHGAMTRSRACNISVFSGELALVKKNNAEAARQFESARDACNIHTMQYLAAGVELKRLGK